MLQLHDCMKQDADFQAAPPQARFEFPAFLVPIAAQLDERRSPPRVLEQLKGRRLA